MQPKTHLELTLPAVDDLTLDEAAIFETGGLTVQGFKAFMATHSNWTPAEVGKLTVKERREIANEIIRRLNDEALPKGSAASS